MYLDGSFIESKNLESNKNRQEAVYRTWSLFTCDIFLQTSPMSSLLSILYTNDETGRTLFLFHVDMCGHVWTYVDMCGHVWTRVDMCGHVWTCVDMCGHVWARVDTCGHVWTRVDTCGHVWTCVDM